MRRRQLTTAATLITCLLVLSACGSVDAQEADSPDLTPTTTSLPNSGDDSGSSTTGGLLPTARTVDGPLPTAPSLEPADPQPGTGPCESFSLVGAEFGSGDYQLDSSADPAIDELMAKLNALAEGWTVELHGHTDSVSVVSLTGGNQKLSELRANALLDRMIERGLDPKRVRGVQGHADRDPIEVADDGTAGNLSRNRRVDVFAFCDESEGE